MRHKTTILVAVITACCRAAFALEPNEILVVANTEQPASVRLARYYCEKRGIPSGNVIPVSLGTPVRDSIGRADYEKRLAGPIRRTFTARKDLAHIRCLVTTYGVPFRVGRRDPLRGLEAQLEKLRQALQAEKDAIAQLDQKGETSSPMRQGRQLRATQIQMEIDRIRGVETDASVDSELSLVLRGEYELYRWQPNLLRDDKPAPFTTLMVSRLDGPSYDIAQGLIDKALVAESKGLAGNACIDSRGLFKQDLYSRYDQSLRDLAILTRLRTTLPVLEERTAALFAAGSCPQTALYCGWYSVGKYVDAFDFVEGAVGFHIASVEAASLHDPNSTKWCTAMLMDGITATLGPVTEPYLHAFPEPRAFFEALFDGHCLVEAYYLTQPFNSWQMALIGDPLYKPFKASETAHAP
ncbi:MAG TPA: TIGR03790 family protein [Sedimentisphaerales bacterium]|jgi:uncharacterized protein (TIGR03790 family)|nr:TIGR03790 family protein [Sedimentisphaerales bacterium]HNU31678.1 TIGR03790 family protein [Sedimentisphaerales bacterium]